jgi:hypothetical protein
MRDDLMPAKVEVDPMVRAAPLRASQQIPVETPRRREVVDREG